MKLRTRIRDTTLNDRAVWQAASLLLAYPDGDRQEQLDTVADLLAHVRGSARPCWTAPTRVCPHWTAPRGRGLRRDVRSASSLHHVPDLLDRRRHPQPRRGDARLRHRLPRCGGAAPKAESPDHLPVVLEFAARVDPVLGRRLLVEHRVPIDVLRDALVESGSVYGAAVEAVCTTLPRATDQEVQRAQRLAQAGPPAEAVGLQPFTLTVPPRRGREGTGMGEIFWDVVPYVTLAIIIVGTWWRYRYDKFGWTTRSSQLYESRLLRIGSPMFHFGILVVIVGHFIGLVIPQS